MDLDLGPSKGLSRDPFNEEFYFWELHHESKRVFFHVISVSPYLFVFCTWTQVQYTKNETSDRNQIESFHQIETIDQ